MRNLILAVLVIICGTVSAQTLVYHENFDLPSGADSINAGTMGGINPATGDTTDDLFHSQQFSYHIAGTEENTQVFFETQSFSTTGKPYVILEFRHIAKLYSANTAKIEVSTDNGQNWTHLNATHYVGEDGYFGQSNSFNQQSHNFITASKWESNNSLATPTNAWWIKERFHLTGVASDTSAPGSFNGFPNVKIRFSADFNSKILPANTQFAAGWFIDDIRVTAGACEVLPPRFNFLTTNIPCYVNRPEGNVPVSFIYPVGVQVHDTLPFDSGIDSVTCYYRINGGSWLNTNMTKQLVASREYRADLTGIVQGDSVDYYIEAWDLSCPNQSRTPDDGYYTFYPGIHDVKCNNFACSNTEVISSFPWYESFDGSLWIAGTGDGDNGSSHRGLAPSVLTGDWTVTPNMNLDLGWSVRNGPTGTANTGPLGDHTTGNDKYLYTEFSPKTTSASTATTLLTPCIDLNDSISRVFSFYYHIYGADSKNIRIDIDTGSSTVKYWNAYSRVKGPQQYSSSDPWKKAYVSLEPFRGSVIKIRLTVISTGSGDKQDMAVDDFRIAQPAPINAQLVEIVSPLNEPCAPVSSVPVEIRVRNLGLDSLTSIPVAYQLDNGPVVRDTLTSINLGLADSTSFVFGDLLSFSPGVSHSFKVWTELNGDIDNSDDSLHITIDPKTGQYFSVPLLP